MIYVLNVLSMLAGSLVMLGAVRKARALIEHLPHERRWRNMHALMLFFVVGYLAAAMAFLTPFTIVQVGVTSVIVILGAVFALLVMSSALRSVHRLLQLRDFGLVLAEVRSPHDLRSKLANMMVELSSSDGCELIFRSERIQVGKEAERTLVLPIECSGELAGKLTVYRKRVPFASDEEILLKTLLHHAVLAMERLEAIHENERRIERLLVDQMSDGVLMSDPQGEVVLANPAALHMLGRQEVGEVTDLQPLGLDLPSLQRSLADKGSGTVTKEITLNRVPARTVLAKTALVSDVEGNPLGCVTTLLDVTRERDLQRMKEDFLASVSHELRTPVTAIAGYALLVKDDRTSSEQRREFVEGISESSERLVKLINDLLDLAKLEAGMMTMNFQPVSLAPVVRSVLSGLRPLCMNKRHNLEVTVPDDLPPVYVDVDRISQVLTNLIGNAIKFTPEEGWILVTASTEASGQHVRVTVADTGPGVPLQDHERIFEKYQQVEDKWTYGIKGTGLGLPIAKQIIDAHGGTIGVDTKAGKGSVFYFTLPGNSSAGE